MSCIVSCVTGCGGSIHSKKSESITAKSTRSRGYFTDMFVVIIVYHWQTRIINVYCVDKRLKVNFTIKTYIHTNRMKQKRWEGITINNNWIQIIKRCKREHNKKKSIILWVTVLMTWQAINDLSLDLHYVTFSFFSSFFSSGSEYFTF